jgi:class 3 adenylate cyclase
MVVDYSVDIYFERLRQLQFAVLEASVAGALVAGLVGLLVARRVTRPVSALTRGVGRVARGDLSQALPVVSRDEIGQLTRAFNDMLEGLRQRDFIRDTFGRYVSPEVARTLLESPEGLKLGGEKRVVTILMSDLRGYTRFAERGDPAWVMDVLNGYLARMTDIVIAHGGTINEFIGDAIFAVFGAPLPHPDHAERAAATALAMQSAMGEINALHEARGLPRFEMGIGVNTGEAVVGNIGSEQRAKYAVVGSAVNVAARVEGCTVGGQVFLSEATYLAVRHIAEVAPPISVEVKGLSAPLVLHELRAIQGRFAQRLPEASVEQDRLVDVTIPVRYWRLDGKTVEGDGHTGLAVRLGPRRIDVRLDEPLPALTNVRLRLVHPEPGHESGDLYGKIVAGADEATAGTAIRLTSVDAADQRVIEMLVGSGLAPVDTGASAR